MDNKKNLSKKWLIYKDYQIDSLIYITKVTVSLMIQKYFENFSSVLFSCILYDKCICTLGGSMWPLNLSNMNEITHRQAAIDSSMPGQFKKCN